MNLRNEGYILDLLQEVYYKCLIKAQTKQYADLLVLIIAFQENILKFLVKQKVLGISLIQLKWKDTENQVRSQIQQGKLGQYIQNYKTDSGQRLRIEGDLSRVALIAILKFFEDSKDLILLLNRIENVCNLRNNLVHELKGVSYLENEAEILETIEEILKMVKPDFNPVNPFNLLNEEIVNRLSAAQY
ncbi:MAG: hypothetical protein GC158_16095 [Cyanobacteria bacterium RI_101]|nr:hypothetical protein [Cyanobacteria bacterium RI_101]